MSAVYRGSFADSSQFSEQQKAIERVKHSQAQAQEHITKSQQMPIPASQLSHPNAAREAPSPQASDNVESPPIEPHPPSTHRPQDALSSLFSGLGGLGGILDANGSSQSGLSNLGDTLISTLSSISEPAGKLLEEFDIDGEKLIILLVMWVVFSENGDNTLLLALGYLLL